MYPSEGEELCRVLQSLACGKARVLKKMPAGTSRGHVCVS